MRFMLAAHDTAERTGVPAEEIIAAHHEQYGDLSRRDFLRTAGIAGAAGATVAVAGGLGLSPALSRANAATAPKVIIVGAGLAGIRAAHYMYRVKGVAATIYEGNDRAGGRCWSLRGFFDDGQIVEHGGAFINTQHTTIRSLANNLGLKLRPVYGGNQPPGGDKYWIDGALYSAADAGADWRAVQRVFKQELADAPFPQTYGSSTPRGRQLDTMTVNEWLDQNVPGGLSSRLAKLLQSDVLAEYGLDPDQQPALNLIYLLGWNPPNSLTPLAGDDEQYTIEGGNDQLVAAMLDQLPPGTVQYGNRLTAMKANSNGSVTCTFRAGNKFVDVTADKVILALPFTTLRDCDLSKSGFSSLKLRAIRELDLGANAKLHVQLNSRPWLDQGYGGVAYSNMTGWQCAWDDTVGQSTPKGILCQFPGGSSVTGSWKGAAFGEAPQADVTKFLAQIEPCFNGVTAAYNGKAYRDAWPLNPWSKGAYTCPKVGQYTTLWGIQSVPEGNVHFAGEHTSIDDFGFLDAAVVSGERAGKEVVG
jgi:monoamine oxidase